MPTQTSDRVTQQVVALTKLTHTMYHDMQLMAGAIEHLQGHIRRVEHTLFNAMWSDDNSGQEDDRW